MCTLVSMAASPSNSNSSDALASLRIDRSQEKKSGGLWKIILLLAFVGGGWYAWSNWGDKASSVLGNNQNFISDTFQKKEEVRLTSVKIKQGRAADAVVVATGYLDRYARPGLVLEPPAGLTLSFLKKGTLSKKMNYWPSSTIKISTRHWLRRRQACLDPRLRWPNSRS